MPIPKSNITISGGVSKTNVEENVISLDGLTSEIDIAQSRYFTVSIDGINTPLENNYLPLKNITYTMTGIDMMTLSLGVFKDVPIPVGKRLPKISLTMVDTSDSSLQKQFMAWYNLFNPYEGYVGYILDMVKYCTYTSYDTTGVKQFSGKFPVMLMDDFSTTRDYEDNSLLTFECNIVVVGPGTGDTTIQDIKNNNNVTINGITFGTANLQSSANYFGGAGTTQAW